MHGLISDWSSEAMYEGKLKAHESVIARGFASIARELPVDGALEGDIDALPTPLLLIDTAGCDMEVPQNRTQRTQIHISDLSLIDLASLKVCDRN